MNYLRGAAAALRMKLPEIYRRHSFFRITKWQRTHPIRHKHARANKYNSWEQSYSRDELRTIKDAMK